MIEDVVAIVERCLKKKHQKNNQKKKTGTHTEKQKDDGNERHDDNQRRNKMACACIVKQHALNSRKPRNTQRVAPKVHLHSSLRPSQPLLESGRHVIGRHAKHQVLVQVHGAKAAHEQVHGGVEVLGDAAV